MKIKKFFIIKISVTVTNYTKNQIMAVRKISEESLSASIVHPREVLAPAIAFHASSILVAHNHPSGNPHPSDDDKHLTEP